MAAPLGRIACDFVSAVVLFASAPEATRPAPSALRAQLTALLEQLASRASAEGLDAAQVEAARFALVAFADELVLLTAWAGHDAWAQEPLQQQLFRTRRAGNEFYERLALLRPDESDAREVFALCLAFGFQGQWAGHDAQRQEILAGGQSDPGRAAVGGVGVQVGHAHHGPERAAERAVRRAREAHHLGPQGGLQTARQAQPQHHLARSLHEAALHHVVRPPAHAPFAGASGMTEQ